MPAAHTLLLAAAAACALACIGPEGETPDARREATVALRDRALAELYAEEPEAREHVERAAGTLFLDSFSIHPGLLTFAKAYGVLENRRTGERRYPDFWRLGIGPGLSVKGFYTLSIVDDEQGLQRLADGGWVSGAFSEASFVFGDFGGSASAVGLFREGVRTYLWTHTGVALEATVGFGRVSPDEDLEEGLAAEREAEGTPTG